MEKKVRSRPAFFLQFYLTGLQGKEYFAKLNQKSVAGAVFWSFGARAGAGTAREKNQELEPEPLEKSQEPEPLKKIAGSPALLTIIHPPPS